jgi:hypothetical protein
LLDELTASDQSSCSDDDDSSGADDLTVGEVIGSECSDNFKAIIVQTKKCRDLLKGIFQKEYH